MTTLLLTFVFMLGVVGIMAIGVVMGRAPISGSCGGMKALGMDVECEICGGNPALCESGDSAETNTADTSAKASVNDLTTKVGR